MVSSAAQGSSARAAWQASGHAHAELQGQRRWAQVFERQRANAREVVPHLAGRDAVAARLLHAVERRVEELIVPGQRASEVQADQGKRGTARRCRGPSLSWQALIRPPRRPTRRAAPDVEGATMLPATRPCARVA